MRVLVSQKRLGLPHRTKFRGFSGEAYMLEDATKRLEGFIDSDGECDNTHEHNKTLCCLCQYRSIIAKACGTAV